MAAVEASISSRIALSCEGLGEAAGTGAEAPSSVAGARTEDDGGHDGIDRRPVGRGDWDVVEVFGFDPARLARRSVNEDAVVGMSSHDTLDD